MSDQKPKRGGQDGETGGGLRAPAKGESSSSEVPREEDGATFIEPPPKKVPSSPRATPSPSPRATPSPSPRITPLPSDRTFDATSTPSRIGGGSYGGVYREVALQPGDQFGGRYEILALLGEGGMGAVYKAADLEVDRTVAQKVIRPEMASNAEILARFKQ